MFTKSLNRETCHFLATKRASLPIVRGFFFFFFNLRRISGVTINGRAHGMHLLYYCIKYICCVRVEYWCFVKVQVHPIFIFQNLQVYRQKMYSKILQMGQFTKLFCLWKLWNYVTVSATSNILYISNLKLCFLYFFFWVSMLVCQYQNLTGCAI